MSSFFIALINIGDPVRYQQYLDGFDAVFQKYEGQVVSVEDNPRTLEGEWPAERTVLIRFPNDQALRRWHESSEYQKLARLRQEASISDLEAHYEYLEQHDAIESEVRNLRKPQEKNGLSSSSYKATGGTMEKRIVRFENEMWWIRADVGELPGSEREELEAYFGEIRLPYRLSDGHLCIAGGVARDAVFERLEHFYDGWADVLPF